MAKLQNTFKRFLSTRVSKLTSENLPTTDALAPSNILDAYTSSAPHPQNAIDIFKGEWASKLPGLQSGAAELFDDSRLTWADEQLSGFRGKHVLELGPLEAGHTYMMEKLGAESITSVESNSRAYLKCLIVKETFGLQRAKFLYGDFIEYLRSQDTKFDICFASGVLYHMRNPVELIDLACHVADKVYLWTHYYDRPTILANPTLTPKFPSNSESEYKGQKYTLYRYEYQAALNSKGFCGGSAPYSAWLAKNDILNSLRRFGFNNVEIAFDDLHHIHGPSFAVAAMRG